MRFCFDMPGTGKLPKEKVNVQFFQKIRKTSQNFRIGPSHPRRPPATIPYYLQPAVDRQPGYRRGDSRGLLPFFIFHFFNFLIFHFFIFFSFFHVFTKNTTKEIYITNFEIKLNEN